MKIVLWMFGIALFMVVPFLEMQPRMTTLAVLFGALVVGRLFLHTKRNGLDELELKKHKGRIHLLYFLIAVVLLTSLMQIDPLRRQPRELRANILNVTTVGMTMEEVAEAVNNRWRWGDLDLDNVVQRGVVAGELQADSPYYIEDDVLIMVGTQSVRATLGAVRYIIFLRYEADAVWVFNADGRLIDVVVHKSFRPRNARE